MKILMVNDLLQGGGVEKLLKDLALYFNEAGHEVTIFTDEKDDAFNDIYPKEIHYTYRQRKKYPKTQDFFLRKWYGLRRKYDRAQLRKEIESCHFDVMLCLKEGWIMQMALDVGASIPKKLAWNHTDYSKSYYTKDIFGSAEAEIACMQKFDHIICVSGVIKESIKTMIGDPGNLTVCYNPLDQEEILAKAKEPVTEIKRKERPLFVTVGRLNAQKGYDVLLEVCNLLNDERYEYDVWIIGGGEAWNNYQVLHDLEEQIRRYHLNNVYLLGPKKNPYKYMAQADWFLSTSRYEGYSYVSQEATIVGKPLLLTECSGVEELLEQGGSGIIMENSFKGIYYGMRDAITKLELLRQYESKVQRKENSFYKEEKLKEIEKLIVE